MTLWRKLVCLVVGHKSSLFPGTGIAAPLTIVWAYPDPTAAQNPHPAPPAPARAIGGVGSIGAPNYSIHGLNTFQGPPTKQGPSFNLDLCQRCLALYVAPPAPICCHCNSIKELHTEDGYCMRPCQNCGHARETHTEGKCLFDASSYKGTMWEKNTSFVSR